MDQRKGRSSLVCSEHKRQVPVQRATAAGRLNKNEITGSTALLNCYIATRNGNRKESTRPEMGHAAEHITSDRGTDKQRYISQGDQAKSKRNTAIGHEWAPIQAWKGEGKAKQLAPACQRSASFSAVTSWEMPLCSKTCRFCKTCSPRRGVGNAGVIQVRVARTFVG
eukprot:598970-Pelagomonas_calceolata.AAC.8